MLGPRLESGLTWGDLLRRDVAIFCGSEVLYGWWGADVADAGEGPLHDAPLALPKGSTATSHFRPRTEHQPRQPPNRHEVNWHSQQKRHVTGGIYEFHRETPSLFALLRQKCS